MTAALSHIGTFNPDMPNGMIQYAQGAEAVGAPTIRIIKPYADENKIYGMIRCAEKNGAIAVGMDIDHMFDLKGNQDICMGEEMEIKSSARLKEYIDSTDLPFIIKGVLSVRDAVKCAEIGAKGIAESVQEWMLIKPLH